MMTHPLTTTVQRRRRHRLLLILVSALTITTTRTTQARRILPISLQRLSPNETNPCHTTFKFGRRPPNENDCATLFDTRVPLEFNHDFVGITNPILHANNNATTPIPNDNEKGNKLIDIESIWPGDGIPSFSSSPLRIIRYRRKVGHTSESYQTLRNIILDWDIHRNSSWAGIRITSPPNQNRETHPFSPLPQTVSDRVLQLWNAAGEKRLVTFSRIGFSPMWAMNPCRVVYDVADRRHCGITYTSTAYATLRGHLLSGEERVTVGIRDDVSLIRRRRNKVVGPDDGGNGGGRDVYVEVLSCSRPAPGALGKLIFPFVKRMQERFFMEEVDTLERIAREVERQRDGMVQHELCD